MKVYVARDALRKFHTKDRQCLIVYKEPQRQGDQAMELDELLSCESCESDFIPEIDGWATDKGNFCYCCMENDL
jgi:hypothetical protein